MWTRSIPDRVRAGWLAPILLPPLIALLWGEPYNDAAYRLALQTRYPLSAIFWGGVLGWMVAIGTWGGIGQSIRQPLPGLVVALLLALHPLMGQTLGMQTGVILGLLSLAGLWAVQDRFIPLVATTIALAAVSPSAPLLSFPAWLWWGFRQRSALNLKTLALGLIAPAVPFSLWGWIAGRGEDPEFLAFLIVVGEILFALAIGYGITPRVRRHRSHRLPVRGLSFIALVALLLLQAGMLWRDWQLRPVDRLTTYREAARWVQEQLLPDETIATAYPGLVEYLSDRRAVGLSSDEPAEEILAYLQRVHPDHCLVPNTLSWQLVTVHPWFQEHYTFVQFIPGSRDPTALLSLFRYTPSPFDGGEFITTSLTFVPSPQEHLELIGYRLDHWRLTPGQPRHLSLYWRTKTGLQHPLRVVLRLTERATGKTWLRMENNAPGGLRADFWPPGQIYEDRYILAPPADLPPGDYDLSLVLLVPNGREIPPVVGTDSEAGAPLLLHLYRPPIVSAILPTPDYPIRFRLGDEIELVGYDAPERIAPGETFRVALYWHALRPIPGDYKVFVHLLATNDILLAQSDSVPVNWMYPTSRWQIGEYIMDEHWLTLDASALRGDAWLATGMYDTIFGERVPVFTDAGKELPEKRILLQQVRIR